MEVCKMTQFELHMHADGMAIIQHYCCLFCFFWLTAYGWVYNSTHLNSSSTDTVGRATIVHCSFKTRAHYNCMSVWFLPFVFLTALFCQTVAYLFLLLLFLLITSFCIIISFFYFRISLSCPAKGQRMKNS